MIPKTSAGGTSTKGKKNNEKKRAAATSNNIKKIKSGQKKTAGIKTKKSTSGKRRTSSRSTKKTRTVRRQGGKDTAAATKKRQTDTDRHTIRSTKAQSDHMRLQLVQYMDSSGYVTWSAKRRKYTIMGTATTEGGLVPCPACGLGQLMMIRSSKSGKRFIGCSNFYGGCDASSPLLQRARLRATKKPCSACGWPEVIFRYSTRQKWTRQCSNISCTTRTQARKDA